MRVPRAPACAQCGSTEHLIDFLDPAGRSKSIPRLRRARTTRVSSLSAPDGARGIAFAGVLFAVAAFAWLIGATVLTVLFGAGCVLMIGGLIYAGIAGREEPGSARLPLLDPLFAPRGEEIRGVVAGTAVVATRFVGEEDRTVIDDALVVPFDVVAGGQVVARVVPEHVVLDLEVGPRKTFVVTPELRKFFAARTLRLSERDALTLMESVLRGGDEVVLIGDASGTAAIPLGYRDVRHVPELRGTPERPLYLSTAARNPRRASRQDPR